LLPCLLSLELPETDHKSHFPQEGSNQYLQFCIDAKKTPRDLVHKCFQALNLSPGMGKVIRGHVGAPAARCITKFVNTTNKWSMCSSSNVRTALA